MLATVGGYAGGRTGVNADTLPLWNDSAVAMPDSTGSLPNLGDTSLLQTSGSKSIQVHVGEGGADIGQELRLSIQGEARPGLFVDARLTDVGRSSDDQVTATLQEVDEMYFRMEGAYGFAQLGDQTWELDRMGLMGVRRSTLGASGALRTKATEIRALYGADETRRLSYRFAGNPGQQKGYVVSVDQGGFAVLVPGSEKVFVNGHRLESGKDYTLNYAGGVLDFEGRVLPGPSDEILVEYDVFERNNLQKMQLVEGAYRSRNLWLDLAGFELSADTDRLRRSAWSDSEWALLQGDRGDSVSLTNDSGVVLLRPQSVRRMGGRMRGQWMERWYFDAELALNRRDSNTVSSQVQGPTGKAYRWEFSSDSSWAQRNSWVKIDLRGDLLEQGYESGLFQGSDRSWDSYELRDKWDLDSSNLEGGLRRDEAQIRLRLPGGWFPGWYQGYRRSLEDSSGWNSLRSRGFMQHQSNAVRSEIAVERVASVQVGSTERWQADAQADYRKGDWRPFAKTKVALWKREGERDTLVGASSGLEWGRESSTRYARGEMLGERSDTARTAQWTQNGDWRGRSWSAHHLFQMRRTQSDISGELDTWLLEQSGNFGRANEAWRGDGAYSLGYTSEVPWEAIYESVPEGTGDVLYDSLAGEYIAGVDNGDFMYVGMGRSDSAKPVRTAHSLLRLSSDLEIGSALSVGHGFLMDLTLGIRGEWEGWDTASGLQVAPPFTRPQLRRRDAGTASLEGIVGWQQPQEKGSVELRIGEEDETHDGNPGSWQERRWQTLLNRYTGRNKEIWSLDLLYEEVERIAWLDLNWNVRQARVAWRRELPMDFSVEPMGRLRISKGDDGFESLAADLWQSGVTIYWRDSRGSGAHVGGTWTRVRTEALALPYALMDGFGIGKTWRGEAQVQYSAHEHFQLTLGYVIRWGDAEPAVFQKMSSEAKAFF